VTLFPHSEPPPFPSFGQVLRWVCILSLQPLLLPVMNGLAGVLACGRLQPATSSTSASASGSGSPPTTDASVPVTGSSQTPYLWLGSTRVCYQDPVHDALVAMCMVTLVVYSVFSSAGALSWHGASVRLAEHPGPRP
jgi:hypothetical protein